MRIRGYEVTYPRALLAALVAVLAVAAGVGLTTSSAAFGAYNPAWDGTQTLRGVADDSGAEAVIGQSMAPYRTADPNATTAVIVSPSENYTAEQAETIGEFVSAGGTLFVAGDFGAPTNELLADLGVSTRVVGAPVRDDQRNYRTPAFPVATNVTESNLTTNVSRVTLNYPSLLAPGADARVLVSTSGFAYVDENGNEELDDSETVASYPVIAVEAYGEGRVVVSSDPSMFVNAMLEPPDNRQFAQNLFADREAVVFDYTHTASVPIAVAIVLAIADSPWLQLLVAALLAGGAALAWRERVIPESVAVRLFGDSEPPAESVRIPHEQVVAGIERRHPDWDSDRVERVARRISERPPNGETNE